MSIKVCFEIGHVAAVKPRQTPEGFTHDWEVFVRGPEGTDISHFVDKVVFTLHDSFPKPRRVIKEPPYAVKEAGYGGFMIPVDVYFKNKGDEPKKASFTYDLDLQERKVIREEYTLPNPSDDFKRKLLKGGGIPQNSSTMSDYKVRHSGSGGVASGDKSQDKKYKKSSGDSDSAKVQSTFANLFGTPITKGASKVSPDPKQISSGSGSKTSPNTGTGSGGGSGSSKSQQQSQKSDRSSSGSSSKDKDKSEKDKSSKHKHSSPNKEKESKKSSTGEEKHSKEKKDKSHSKERDKTKDKSSSSSSSSSFSKRPASPKRNSTSAIQPPPAMTNSPSSSSSAKRNPSPMAPAPTTAGSSNSSSKPDDGKSSSKHGSEKEKKKDKKDKKSYDKDRSEKKDREPKKDAHDSKAEVSASAEKPKSDLIKPSRLDAVKLDSKMYSKEKKISDDSVKVEPAVVQPVPPVQSPAEAVKRVDKVDTKEKDKEERKHKHKKKDKSKDKEKDRSSSSKDKKEKKEKDKSSSGGKSSFATPLVREPEIVSPVKPAKLTDPIKTVERETQPAAAPLQTLIKQLNENNSSDSEADSPPSLINDKDSENSNSSIADLLPARPPSAARQPEPSRQTPVLPTPTVVVEPPKAEKSHHKSKKDKVKSNSSESKDETKKRKRKNKDTDVEKEKDKKTAAAVTSTAAQRSPSPPTPPPTMMEPPVKIPKRDEPYNKREESPAPSNNNNNNSSAKLLPPEESGTTSAYYNNNNSSATPAATMASPAPPPPLAPVPSTGGGGQSNSGGAAGTTAATMTNLSGDYMSELKDLQHKIMTLQDNNELQRVVEMIAATGCYEITSATFDFDLCALDRHTVQRLQEFFATSCSS